MSVGVLIPPPDVGLDSGPGGGSEWVELTVVANDIEAHLLTGRLSESGIDTHMAKHPRSQGAWLYGGSDPWGPVIVYVRSFQLTDARILMAEISFEAPPAVPERDRGPARPVVWWMTALVLGVFLTGVALAQTARSLDLCDLPLLCGQAADPGR